MSAQHTQGRLISWPDRNGRIQVGTSTNYTVAEMCITPLEGQAANARRLVACWNACHGVPTEVLEKQTAGGLPWRVADQIDMLAQRDELLAALEVAEGSVGDMKAMEIVRAAIAKVKGGAA